MNDSDTPCKVTAALVGGGLGVGGGLLKFFGGGGFRPALFMLPCAQRQQCLFGG